MTTLLSAKVLTRLELKEREIVELKVFGPDFKLALSRTFTCTN